MARMTLAGLPNGPGPREPSVAYTTDIGVEATLEVREGWLFGLTLPSPVLPPSEPPSRLGLHGADPDCESVPSAMT